MRRAPLLLVPLVVLMASSALAYPRPGRTAIVSIATDGSGRDGSAVFPQITGDGRLVAFTSQSPLTPEDTNDERDVYVRDLAAGTTELVSVAAGGGASDGSSDYPGISANGRYVSFSSVASNLVDPPAAGAQVYLRDLQAGTTMVVSVGLGGALANSESAWSSVTPDGRYVAFDSLASNLVPGDTNNAYDVFVRDLEAGTTERVNVSSTGGQATGFSGGGPKITPDGRYVAFYTWAALVPDDRNTIQDVYLRDRVAGLTERISVSSEEAEASSISYGQSISDDGRYVAFQSLAPNLVPSDFDGGADALVRDRVTGTTEAVSVTSDGENSGAFLDTKISGDGRFVLFQSAEANLGAGGIPGALNVYVHDRLLGLTDLASVGDAGQAQNGWAGWAAISDDARHVAFESTSSNLGPADDDGSAYDVYLRDRGPVLGIGELRLTPGQDGVSASGWATFSGAVLAAAPDPGNDATAGAGALGAEITAASLAVRTEREDLRMRIDLSDLPSTAVPSDVCRLVLFACPGSTGGAPAIVYGMAFRVGGVPYEIRVVRSAPDPVFRLYRCDATLCTEVVPLKGGLGTMGDVVVASVRLAALGANPGAVLTDVRAFTAVGEAAAPLVTLDEAELGSVTVPAPRIEIAADDGEWKPAFHVNGSFGMGVTASEEVRARACLGSTCSEVVSSGL